MKSVRRSYTANNNRSVRTVYFHQKIRNWSNRMVGSCLEPDGIFCCFRDCIDAGICSIISDSDSGGVCQCWMIVWFVMVIVVVEIMFFVYTHGKSDHSEWEICSNKYNSRTCFFFILRPNRFPSKVPKSSQFCSSMDD